MSVNGSSAATSLQYGSYGNPYVLLTGAVLAAAIFIRWYTTNSSTDSREPPVLYPKVPIIGHLLGIMQLQADYLQKLCTNTQLPIFTLKIPSTKIYVITSPELIQAVFRNSKTLSFDPISSAASKRIFHMTDRQMNILHGNDHGGDGEEDHALIKATTKVMHSALQPSPSVFKTNANAMEKFASALDGVGEDGMSVNLYDWVEHHFTIATAHAVYGPMNPISEDLSMIQKLFDFESSIGLLFLDILPSITCRAGHRARADFAAAFKRYYDNKHYLSSSALILGRHASLTSGGYNTDDLATFDLGILMAATMNSNPGLFWLISYIYSSPTLLSSIRAEIDAITTLLPSTSRTKNREAHVDITLLHSACPLLVSAWQETLRVRAATVPNRLVVSDTLLHSSHGTYLLQKGAVIQMPCQPMHTSPLTWGPSSTTFSASRFLPAYTSTLDKDEKKKRKQAFNPFGGGSVLCPGRYFASSEIMGVVALLVAGFEIEDVRVLDVKMQVMSAQIKAPDGDLNVRIKRRKGWEGVRFKFDSGSGDVADDLVFG
ncbi:cytochrome P450 [Rhexocercosporidium sp. MPI-PUGE-AT-0058]|nr:cytochrome P450 [Rhexocercosporidium sp. MPI-PUGE-AT-0058]